MKYTLIISFICFAARLSVFAQSGNIDLTFNPSNPDFGNSNGADDLVYTIATQTDGKIIIGGEFHHYNGTPINHFTRINADGSIDTSFHTGTGTDGCIQAIAIQTNGKILIGGWFSTFNGTAHNGIIRLNPDGSLDNTFVPYYGVGNNVKFIALQTNGKIFAVGTSIQRLNVDGTIDYSFNPSQISGIKTILLRSDGKLYIGGNWGMSLLNTNGSVDASFNVASSVTDVRAIGIQSDGKVIAGGGFTTFGGSASYHIVRINPNGTKDFTYNCVAGTDDYINLIAVQPDDKIILGGNFTKYNLVTRYEFARVNSDGTLDASFNTFTSQGYIPNSALVLNDGKIMIGIAGNTGFSSITQNLFRLNTDGRFDYSFNPGNGANGNILSTLRQNDGKIIFGGSFKSSHGCTRNGIARLNMDGSLDTSYNPGESSVIYGILSLSPYPDEKLLISGFFSSINGIPCYQIARLNADGTLDTTFQSLGQYSNPVLFSVLLNDGKILATGNFLYFDNDIQHRIVRLFPDGTFDQGYNTGTGPNNTVRKLALQSDSKVILTGTFTSFNGTTRNSIARINSDGSLDTTFSTTNASNVIYDCPTLLNDGKILVSETTLISSQYYYRIIRLFQNGAIDTSFHSGTGPSYEIRTISLQEDGKIIVGGDFTTYNGMAYKRIVRLFANGTIDPSFQSGSGADYAIYCSLIQPDGNIIIAGNFNSYQGFTRKRIARILKCTPNLVNTNKAICQGDSIHLGGIWQSATGIYLDTLQNVFGCDSIVTTHLFLLNPSDTTLSITACNAYTLNSQVYSQSGTYQQNQINSTGCDSIITLNLVVDHSSFAGTDASDSICYNVIQFINLFDYIGEHSSGGSWIDSDNSGYLTDSIFSTQQIHQNAIYHFKYITQASAQCQSDTAIVTLFANICDNVLETISDDYQIFPNPVKNNLTIYPSTNNKCKIEIFNILGHVIHSEDTNIPIIINMENQPEGIYLIRLKSEIKMISKVIIKE